VVPLGVDPGLFHPLPELERAALRRRLGIDGFVFLNLGAMTGNKNIGMLLKAFAVIVARHPHARLLLKGNDGLYPSQQLLGETSQGLSAEEEKLVWSRTSYAGQTVGFRQIADLYQASDAYVSPYIAEGFNLPVLEAAACGLPVICTAGGSTDDFTSPEFALRVAADVVPWAHGGFHGVQLSPSLESLVAQMHRAIEDSAFGDQARTVGPRFVASGFLWPQVVDRLLEVLFPEARTPVPASAGVPIPP
jgi:glycosyltransferase involved in cell wall biosynthesis